MKNIGDDRMKKMLRARTWVIIPLTFLLILQVFSPFSVAAVLGEEDSSSKDTANIQFSLDGETNQELYPIQGYMAKVSLNASGDGAVFKDTTVTLEINHDMINEITIDLPSRAKEIKFYKHDNKAYFDIIFEEIRGGEDFFL